MELMKIILFIAITMAISITLTVTNIREFKEKPPFKQSISDHDDASTTLSSKWFATHEEMKLMPSKRLSRFLAEERNPRAADHCRRDNEICYIQGRNSTCCNNKCIDLSTDDNNCGACKNKCRRTESCCRGECVYLSFDKRHCGRCNNRCPKGDYCVFGMCSYA